MSVRVLSRPHTNTTHINKLLTNPLYLQIMDVLGREEMTFQELVDLVKKDEGELSIAIDELVQRGVIRRHFHHHRVMYTMNDDELTQTVHILYELWAEKVQGFQRI